MKRFTFAPALAAALLASTGPRAEAAGFLEPPLTLFGKVTTSQGAGFQLYSGDLEWTFDPPGASVAPFTITGRLEAVADGLYSYRLRVPVENLPAGFEASTDTLTSTPSETTYAVAVTVNGEPATLAAPDGTPQPDELTFAEILRGTFLEVDLQLAGIGGDDSDGDGLPDAYETLPRFAGLLDHLDPTDALADGDGDGIPTLVEFYDGTDPFCYEFSRWLADNHLEGAPELAGFDQDPDLDGLPNGFEYAFDGDPRSPDRDAVLSRINLEIGEFETLFTAVLPGTRQCGANYLVELSEDLMTWSPATISPTLVLTELPTLIVLQEGAGRCRFVRVRITAR